MESGASAVVVTAPTARCLLVWATVTGGLAGAAAWCGTDARAALSAATWHGPAAVEDVLVAVCAAAALACLGWLWLVATATTLQLLAGRDPGELRRRGGLTRRLVLGLCGAAAVAQLTQPALAADRGPVRPLEESPRATSSGRPLAGLSLPDRATVRGGGAPAPRSAGTPAGGSVVVRPGDSLWSLSERAAPGSSDAELDRLWRAAYAANHDVIGHDPDLIHPGQHLRLPGPPTTEEQP